MHFNNIHRRELYRDLWWEGTLMAFQGTNHCCRYEKVSLFNKKNTTFGWSSNKFAIMCLYAQQTHPFGQNCNTTLDLAFIISLEIIQLPFIHQSTWQPGGHTNFLAPWSTLKVPQSGMNSFYIRPQPSRTQTSLGSHLGGWSGCEKRGVKNK